MNSKKNVLKKIIGYFYLIVSISIVTIFVLYIAPCIDDVEYVKPLTSFIDEREINAGALYYTDIEEFSTAEINIRNTIDYVPFFNSDIPGVREYLIDN
jgi:hypothetical protein